MTSKITTYDFVERMNSINKFKSIVSLTYSAFAFAVCLLAIIALASLNLFVIVSLLSTNPLLAFALISVEIVSFAVFFER